jgi:hypothetical protein
VNPANSKFQQALRLVRTPRPQAQEFLFSGRGPLHRFQREALDQRRSWLDPQPASQAA